MIRKLYDGMLTLLKSLMKEFIKKKGLFNDNEDLKAGENLLEIDVSRAGNHTSLNCIEISTKARLHFNEYAVLVGDEVLKFRRKCLKFYNMATE